MNIAPVGLEKITLPWLIDFLKQTWGQSLSEEFVRWRYYECPNQSLSFITDDTKIAAMLGAFERTYSIQGELHAALEPFDWACSPEFQNSGVGIWLMKHLMERRLPIVVVGGSAPAQRIYPKLGFRRVGESRQYALFLSARGLSQALASRLRSPRALIAPLSRLLFALRFGRPKSAMRSCGTERVSSLYPSMKDRATFNGTGTNLLWSDEYGAWLQRAPEEMGRFLPLSFFEGDRLCGWTLSRAGVAQNGLKVARLIEVGALENRQVLSRIVQGTVQHLQSLNLDVVYASTGWPLLKKVFRNRRFVPYGRLPIFFKTEYPLPFPSPYALGINSADLHLLPLA
jgi:RimJ/RimL family protein N-acetyltransferase